MSSRHRTQWIGSRYLQAVGVAAFVCALARPVATAAAAQLIPRVRSDNPEISTLIEEGRARSATFQRLVDTIDGTDGIVYLEEGKCLNSVHACLMLSVQVAGPNRILHVKINLRRRRAEVISAIGHELRHVVEALSQPKVRDSAAIYMFFKHEGASDTGRFETPAAVEAGRMVEAELAASGKRKPSGKSRQ
jgi:hypothetical protein